MSLGTAPVLMIGSEALSIFGGHHLGSVDYWLCQFIHQTFGDSLVEFPHALRA